MKKPQLTKHGLRFCAVTVGATYHNVGTVYTLLDLYILHVQYSSSLADDAWPHAGDQFTVYDDG